MQLVFIEFRSRNIVSHNSGLFVFTLYCWDEWLNIIPESMLVLFKSLVSVKQFFVKLSRKFRHFFLHDSDLFTKFLMCEFLFLTRLVQIRIFLARLLFEVLLDFWDLANHLWLESYHQLLNLLEVGLCVNLVCHGFEVQELWFLLQCNYELVFNLFNCSYNLTRLLANAPFRDCEFLVSLYSCLFQNAKKFLKFWLVKWLLSLSGLTRDH